MIRTTKVIRRTSVLFSIVLCLAAVRSTRGQNTPPFISGIADQTIPANLQISLGFTIGDLETPVTNLLVTGTSSNTNLVANTGIAFAGSTSAL